MGEDFELEKYTTKVGLPAWLLQLEWTGEWARKRNQRVGDVIERAAQLAAVPSHELPELLAANDDRLELFGDLAGRAAEYADPRYREILARLIAAACDDAKVDVVVYMSDVVAKISPIELRLFMSLFDFHSGSSDRTSVAPSEARSAVPRARVRRSVAERTSIDPTIAHAALNQLSAMGLTTTEEQPGRTIDIRDEWKWIPAPLGVALIECLWPDEAPA